MNWRLLKAFIYCPFLKKRKKKYLKLLYVERKIRTVKVSSKHFSPKINILYLLISAVFIPVSIAPIPLKARRNWIFGLFLRTAFLRAGILSDRTIAGFPLEACWFVSPCPAEACGVWLTSWWVAGNIFWKKKKERNPEKAGEYISSFNNNKLSSVRPPLSKAHRNKQIPQSFRTHNASYWKYCLFPGGVQARQAPPS